MRRYPWDYENIVVGDHVKKFVVVSVIDVPVELASSDGKWYALWIEDREDGELWFLVKIKKEKSLADYLKGAEPIAGVFRENAVSIAKRDYDNYYVFKPSGLNPEEFTFPDPCLKAKVDPRVYRLFTKMFEKPFALLLL